MQELPISGYSDFARILFSRNFAYAKFHENKTLAKCSEFTLYSLREKPIADNHLGTLPLIAEFLEWNAIIY